MELSKYKICPQCGEKNPPSQLDCSSCDADLTGVRIVDDSTAEKKPEEPPVREDGAAEAAKPELVRICECGVENVPQARKCRACGEDISDILPVRREAMQSRTLVYELKAPDGSLTVTMEQPSVILGREAELKEYLQTKSYVSRRQARLTVTEDGVLIENLSRTNKTYLNNEKLPDGAPAALRDGDEIGLGGKVIGGSRQEQAAYFIFRRKA